MRMKRLLVLTAAALFAQDSTFKSDTKLVIVDLTVRDKSGRPITNLTKDDVVILRVQPDGVKLEFVKSAIAAVTTGDEA